MLNKRIYKQRNRKSGSALVVKQERNAGGKSWALAAAMAPMLAPMVTELIKTGAGGVSQIITAARGGSALSVRQRGPRNSQPTIASDTTSTFVNRATPDSYGGPLQKIGVTPLRLTPGQCDMVFKDEIGTVTIPASAWGSAVTSFPVVLNPASSTLHPTSYPQAYMWSDYKLKSLELIYEPNVGANQDGSVVFGYVDSTVAGNYGDSISSELRAASINTAILAAANQRCSFRVPFQESWKTTRAVGATASVDPAEISPGVVFCAATNLDGSTHAVGKLFISAQYTLYTRRPYYAGAGLVLQMVDLANRAQTEDARNSARVKMVECLEFLYSDISRRLTAPPPMVSDGMSAVEAKKRLSLLASKTTTN